MKKRSGCIEIRNNIVTYGNFMIWFICAIIIIFASELWKFTFYVHPHSYVIVQFYGKTASEVDLMGFSYIYNRKKLTWDPMRVNLKSNLSLMHRFILWKSIPIPAIVDWIKYALKSFEWIKYALEPKSSSVSHQFCLHLNNTLKDQIIFVLISRYSVLWNTLNNCNSSWKL